MDPLPARPARSSGQRAIIRLARAITVQHVTAGAFAVVAGVAAVISYDHVRTLAAGHWWAWLLPLSIDGLLVAGSLALWLQRSAGERGSALTWLSVVLGLLASLAANLASTNPLWFPKQVVDVFVAVWPPIALALAFELVVRVRRFTSAPPPKDDGSAPRRAAAPAPPRTTTVTPAAPEPRPQAARTPAAAAARQPAPDREARIDAAARWSAAQLRAKQRSGREQIRAKFPDISADDAKEAARRGRALVAQDADAPQEQPVPVGGS